MRRQPCSIHCLLWNIEKHYLKDLQDKGVPIVSTRWSNAFNNSVIDEA